MGAFDGLKIPDLAGKAVLITGASTGIGAALAREFARQGAKVAVHYNSSAEAAEVVAADIKAAGGEAILIKGDVTSADETRRVVNEAAEGLGGLDGLINNAGLMLGRVALGDITDEHFSKVLDLNARSVVVAMQTAAPLIATRGGGFIINTTSIAARTGAAGGGTLYGAAKSFVSTFTRGMAKELIGAGIRVNAVAPGVIETPFHERYTNAQQMATMVSGIPQGRVGTPEECVGAFLYLASPMLSGYMIGQILEVNGGQLMP